MSDVSYERMREEVLANREARIAAQENRLRRSFSKGINAERAVQVMSVRGFAKAMGTSLSQAQRVLHQEHGGSLSLSTLCRAADALDLDLGIHIRPRTSDVGAVIPFGRVAYVGSDAVAPRAKSLRRRSSRAVRVRAHGDGWTLATASRQGSRASEEFG